MSKSEKYGKALDELEALHRAGQISDARYEMHKTKLITEASSGTAGPIARFSTWLFIGFLVLIGLGIVVGVVSSLV